MIKMAPSFRRHLDNFLLLLVPPRLVLLVFKGFFTVKIDDFSCFGSSLLEYLWLILQHRALAVSNEEISIAILDRFLDIFAIDDLGQYIFEW